MDESLIREQEAQLQKTGRYYKHICFMAVPVLCMACFLHGVRPDQRFIHKWLSFQRLARCCTAAAGSAAPNTALPATRISAPASTHWGAVALSTPPSTSSR